MLKYTFKRFFQMIPTVMGVILLTFFLFNVVGGDLAANALGKNVSLQMLEDFDEQRGLDKPLFWGTRSPTRAYEDHDFSDGAGRWRAWADTSYSAQSAPVVVQSMADFNPLAFDLKPEREYEWTSPIAATDS